MGAALQRASEKEWIRLAAAAGLASDESAAAARVGRQIELRARTDAAGTAATRPAGDVLAEPDKTAEGSPSLVDRIKAVLAA